MNKKNNSRGVNDSRFVKDNNDNNSFNRLSANNIYGYQVGDNYSSYHHTNNNDNDNYNNEDFNQNELESRIVDHQKMEYENFIKYK